MDSKPSLNDALLTGANGFLGRIFNLSLQPHFDITTLGRSTNDHIFCDLSQHTFQPNKSFHAIIHNAGKAHSIPHTPREEEAFYKDNVEGTQNLLRSLEKLKPLPSIFISSIAVYGIKEGVCIDEQSPLNPQTPYAQSKALAEKVALDWCEQNGVNWVILRLPLVVGPTPPGNLGTMRNAIARKRYLRITNNSARKSMVVAEDVAQLIPQLEGKKGCYNLTDSIHPTFPEIEDAIAKALHKSIPLSLPKGLARLMGKLGDSMARTGLSLPFTTERFHKITATLTFSDEKARQELGWRPRPAIPYIREGGLEKRFPQ